MITFVIRPSTNVDFMRASEMRRIFKSLLLRSLEAQNSLKKSTVLGLFMSEAFWLLFGYTSRPFEGCLLKKLVTFSKKKNCIIIYTALRKMSGLFSLFILPRSGICVLKKLTDLIHYKPIVFLVLCLRSL